METIAWIDLEVTSFSSTKGALTQISCIIEKNEKEFDRINLFINPFSYLAKMPEILEYNLKRSNRTIEEVKRYPNSKNQFKLFKKFIDKNLNPRGLFQLAGHNVEKHDSRFIEEWFKDNSEDMHKYFSYEYLDTLHLSRHMKHWGLLDGCDNNKLGTLCEYFEVKLESWHNSIEDIQATRELYMKMQKKIHQ